MTDLPPITRPNGKPYRPRVLSANAVAGDDDWLAGVIVLGTHDVDRAQPMADSYARWQLGDSYAAADPDPGWYRDGFEGSRRCWVRDEERGRAGVWFRGIVEAADARQLEQADTQLRSKEGNG